MRNLTTPPLNLIAIIDGRVLYRRGPWGSDRPLRKAGLSVKTRDPSTNQEFLVFATGGDPYTFADYNGEYSITFNTANINPSDFSVEIFSHNSTGGVSHTYQLIPGPVDPSKFGRKQQIGELRVPWPPMLSDLAEINKLQFENTQNLSRALSALLRSLIYPIHIELFREGEKFTNIQYKIKALGQPNLPDNLPERLVYQAKAWLPTHSNTLADAIITMLDKISTIDITKLDLSYTTLNQLLKTLESVGIPTYSANPLENDAIDLAGACVLFFVTGLMPKHTIHRKITYGTFNLGSATEIF
jgi:hypothetical protein